MHALTPGSPIRSANGVSIDVDLLRSNARTHFRFDIQVASELYWRGKQNDYHLEKDFGSLRLPYPHCWMEWRWPDTLFLDGKDEVPAPQKLMCAAVADETELDDGTIGIRTQLLLLAPGNPITVMPAFDSIRVDALGTYIRGSRRWGHSGEGTDAEKYALAEGLTSELNAFYLALNLINCKNVHTDRAGSLPLRQSGRAKRRREPRLDYHTIVLPGMTRGGDATGLNREVMPLHRVRGHFKTFTADSPLLGQHVGTYWWGWQVRGKKENGVVVSDYKVGVPA